MEITAVADRLDQGVGVLQMIVAGLLAVMFVLGVLNFAVEIVRSILAGQAFTLSGVISLISSSIDIVLYLFIVVELYKTIIAYVEAENVVIAVIHAGLIAVVRQIITFDPAEYAGPTATLLGASVYALLLLALVVSFWIVHRRIDRSDGMDTNM